MTTDLDFMALSLASGNLEMWKDAGGRRYLSVLYISHCCNIHEFVAKKNIFLLA